MRPVCSFWAYSIRAVAASAAAFLSAKPITDFITSSGLYDSDNRARIVGSASAPAWLWQNPTVVDEGNPVTHTVRAEMVASIHSIIVEVGDEVGPTDAIVILESMKMEIPVLTEGPGRIAEVKVTAGDVVQEGEVLVVIDD